jgi:hypothetical protein
MYVSSDSGGVQVWKRITSAFVSVDSGGVQVWKRITSAFVSVDSGGVQVWKRFFQSALSPSIASRVEISRNNATQPSTLTGTNYRWTDSTSLSYVFQKSSDDSSWTDIGTATSIANPAVGGSNTVTYALTVADMPAYTSYYRFVVTASNSTYSTTTTSTSTSVSVKQPAPINTVAPAVTPSTGVQGVDTFTTTNGTWNPVDTDGVYAYQWQYNDQGSTFIAISGATSSTYTPPSNFLSLYTSPIRCRVTATNDSGSTAAFSNQVSVTLAKPSGGSVAITGSGAAGRNLTVTTSGWSNSPSASGYDLRLYARTTNPPVPGGIGTVLKASTTSSSLTYLVTNVDASTPAYYFKAFATASNAAGTSTEVESNVVLSFLPTTPGLVTSFTSTSSLSGTTLSWNATWSAPSDDGGADITSYKVYVERAVSNSGPWLASTTSISTSAGGTYSGAYTVSSPFVTANATTPKTLYGRVTGTSTTWIRVFVAAVNSVGTGTYNTAIG